MNTNYQNGIRGFLGRPLLNLSRRARIIFWLRFTTSILAIVFSIILLKADTFKLPVSFVHCENAQVAAGLYDTLKKTSTAQNSFITTSEIKLLTYYIEHQIEGMPEVLVQGIHSWCSIDYTYVKNHEQLELNDEDHLLNLDKIYPRKNHTINCYSSNKKDTFDYRTQISKIGLNIILAYAFDADFSKDDTKSKITHSNHLATDEVFEASLSYWENLANKYETVVSISIGFEVSLLLGLFLFYSGRNSNRKDNPRSTFWIKNVLAIIATVNMLLSVAGVTYHFFLVSAFTNSVEDELSSFGVHAEGGTGYIIVLMFWLCSAIGIFVEISGPIWCDPRVKKPKLRSSKVILNSVTVGQPDINSHRDYNYDEAGDDYNDDDDINYDVDQQLDFDDYEMDSIAGQDNPFQSESESDTLTKTESVKKQTTLVESESSVVSRINTPLDDSNKGESVYSNKQEVNFPNVSKFSYSNPMLSKSEQLFNQRKSNPSFVKPLINPTARDSELSDMALVPMSPILMSHQNDVLKEKNPSSRHSVQRELDENKPTC